MTITATYSPEDNKIRLYPSERLDAETYARVKESGFSWAPKQGLFVAPRWTPTREDLAIELAGDIEPEEMTLAERAALKAERLEGLAHKRYAEANAFARRTVIKARATQRAWWKECDLVERLTAAKRETVRDLCDMKERATKAEAALIDAHTQAEILGKSLREASERALKAETALAAIQARADGWPPAVRPASVVVHIQRAA